MTFTAQYRGRCWACDERIEPGDECAYDEDDEVIHVDCRTRSVTPQEPCPTCWTVPAANGECGCD